MDEQLSQNGRHPTDTLVRHSALCEDESRFALCGQHRMGSSWLSRAVVFISVLIMIVTLAWLTQIDNSDPCTQQAADIGAAVLADAVGDQDALVNRAIIVQGKCEDDSR